MKLNISYPANGSQKLVEIEDERKLRDFMEKRVRRRTTIHETTRSVRARKIRHTTKHAHRETIETNASGFLHCLTPRLCRQSISPHFSQSDSRGRPITYAHDSH